REALFELERRIHQHDVVLAYRQLEGGRRGVAADVLAVDHDARPRIALEHDVTGRTMRPRCVSMVIARARVQSSHLPEPARPPLPAPPPHPPPAGAPNLPSLGAGPWGHLSPSSPQAA